MKSNPEILTWHGCYDKSLRGVIQASSFAHPAKMSRALCERIIQHGFERGYWQEGSIVLDPFAGIGTTLLLGAYAGLRVIGIELEPRFAAMCRENIDLNAHKLDALHRTRPVIIQGDSRKLRELIGQAQGVISSPPYGGNARCDYTHETRDGDYRDRNRGMFRGSECYGNTEGQIGRMSEGDVSGAIQGVIASPPYISGGHHPDQTGAWGGQAQSVPKELAGYGKEPGQIGQMKEGDLQGVISSPPYLGARSGTTASSKTKGGGPCADRVHTIADGDRLGNSEGQLAAIKVGDPSTITGAITSPPWEKGAEGTLRKEKFKDPEAFAAAMSERDGKGTRNGTTPASRLAQMERDAEKTYGDSDGQIGNEQGETYWGSVAIIYRQLYELLPEGGTVALVLKDFIRNKQRVPLVDQTAELLEALGFTITERVRAMLVEETVTGTDLFTKEPTKARKERKSFFRRLHEKKFPELAINYEEVLFARKLPADVGDSVRSFDEECNARC